MFVNKIKIGQNNLTGNTYQIGVPIMQNHGVVGQTDIINNEFVEIEKERAINPIIDYEKVRFTPANSDNEIMNQIQFKLKFFYGNGHNKNTWSDIEFTPEDLLYHRNSFTKSFLRLVFYDSDNLISQSPLFVVTLFPQANIDVNNEIIFKRQNPITSPNGFAEGFYQYFYKDMVENDQEYDVYMRAEFLNAKTGLKVPLMMYNGVPSYDDTLSDKIHLKFTFKKDNNNYLYIVDDTSDEVSYTQNKKIEISLYESVTE